MKDLRIPFHTPPNDDREEINRTEIHQVVEGISRTNIKSITNEAFSNRPPLLRAIYDTSLITVAQTSVGTNTYTGTDYSVRLNGRPIMIEMGVTWHVVISSGGNSIVNLAMKMYLDNSLIAQLLLADEQVDGGSHTYKYPVFAKFIKDARNISLADTVSAGEHTLRIDYVVSGGDDTGLVKIDDAFIAIYDVSYDDKITLI